MRYILVTTVVVFSHNLFSGTINHPKFDLPEKANSWSISETASTEKTNTYVYKPLDYTAEHFLESFTVHMIYGFLARPTEDPLLMQKYLNNLYPNKTICIFPLKEVGNPLIYEWIDLSNNVESGYGLGSFYEGDLSSAFFLYKAEGDLDIEEIREKWLPTFQKATAP